MISFFANLAFLNPWVLSAIAALPALYFLLRITPPAPKHILFPATHFLKDLVPENITAQKTPWWILLLRILIMLLVIIALAQPVLNPVENTNSQKPLRLIIDNSWAAAQSWDLQTQEAERLITIATRERRNVHLFTTAPAPGKETPFFQGPVTASQAKALMKGIVPQPWPADYKALTTLIKNDQKDSTKFETYWLGHGLNEGETNIFDILSPLTYLMPDEHRLPIILRKSSAARIGIAAQISTVSALPSPVPLTVNVTGAGGRILDIQNVTISDKNNPANVTFELPDDLFNQAERIAVSGQKGAGGIILLDSSEKRVNIAIVTPAGENDKTPLMDDSYYIERALSPYSHLTLGMFDDILPETPNDEYQTPAVIILSNVGSLPAQQLNRLESWIKNGGLLLRFAGPNMAQGQNFLTPVPLMQGNRALDGDLTWEEPVKLTTIKNASPLYGLELPEDGITVRRQLLAAPTSGLNDKIWAQLEDGTPIISADRLEKGMVIMVHTSATTEWSDLPLSGFFVKMLRRIVSLSGHQGQLQDNNSTLQPRLIMDGFGALKAPDAHTLPIPAKAFETTMISSRNPPGIYGSGPVEKVLNLGDRIGVLKKFENSALNLKTKIYEQRNETDLMPFVLVLAFILFLGDWLIMIFISSGLSSGVAFRYIKPIKQTAIVIACICVCTNTAHAQSISKNAEYAGNIYLAYITSNDPGLNAKAQKGLTNLAKTLRQRTSVEPAGVVGVNLDKDELAFFPLIYWPISSDAQTLSPNAQINLQKYLDQGGTVLIDSSNRFTSMQTPSTQGQSRQANQNLQILLADLNIPPLMPMPKDHVLTKTFYLLTNLHDARSNTSLWVESQSADGRDGVSSIIIDSRDWASIWAGMNGSSRNQELAQRFGVNLMLYALTGNYKADQVHLPFIMERLGQ